MSKPNGHTGESLLPRGDAGLFENLPKYLTTEEAAKLLGRSKWTIYDWKKQPLKYGTPKNLFHPFGRRLYIRTKTLEQWFKRRNRYEPQDT